PLDLSELDRCWIQPTGRRAKPLRSAIHLRADQPSSWTLILHGVQPGDVEKPLDVHPEMGEQLVTGGGLGFGGVHRLPRHPRQGFAGLLVDVVSVHVGPDDRTPNQGDGVTPNPSPGHGRAPSRYRSKEAASKPPTAAASR